ncbi:MAG: hypothetical protein JO353_10420 [Phycisphaerae bacterium]|nr:hypothetical protein [Phycisphaerae bacterium]
MRSFTEHKFRRYCRPLAFAVIVLSFPVVSLGNSFFDIQSHYAQQRREIESQYSSEQRRIVQDADNQIADIRANAIRYNWGNPGGAAQAIRNAEQEEENELSLSKKNEADALAALESEYNQAVQAERDAENAARQAKMTADNAAFAARSKQMLEAQQSQTNAQNAAAADRLRQRLREMASDGPNDQQQTAPADGRDIVDKVNQLQKGLDNGLIPTPTAPAPNTGLGQPADSTPVVDAPTFEPISGQSNTSRVPSVPFNESEAAPAQSESSRGATADTPALPDESGLGAQIASDLGSLTATHDAPPSNMTLGYQVNGTSAPRQTSDVLPQFSTYDHSGGATAPPLSAYDVYSNASDVNDKLEQAQGIAPSIVNLPKADRPTLNLQKPDSVKLAENGAKSVSPLGNAGAKYVLGLGDKINNVFESSHANYRGSNGR